MTQTMFAGELNASLGTNYSKPHISLMERGIMVVPPNVESYIESKIASNAVITSADERNDDRWTTTPPCENKSLKTAIPQNWSAKGLTQKERVLGYVYEQGSITSKEAYDFLGITQLGARIFELEREGYRFDRKNESSFNRYGKAVSFTRYSMEKNDGKEDMDRQRYMD